ncbi:MAG: Lon-like protease helical domain-containing protein, partial [Acidobacteriota bacterium]
MASEKSHKEVPVEKLRWRCSPDRFSFDTTAELPCHFDIIGQERAVKAIKLGLSVGSRGYNIFVQGLTGTGKETTVKCILEQVAGDSGNLSDKCYVHNFDDPDSPTILYLAPGTGASFRREMEALVEYIDRTVPAVLESDEFQKRRSQIVEKEGGKGQAVIRAFEERIKQENFVLVEIRMGPITKTEIAPIVDGKPRTEDDLEKMLAQGKVARDEFERIQKARETLGVELEGVMKQARALERQIGEALKALVYGFGAEIVNPRIEELKGRFQGEKVKRYLENVRHHIMENLEGFARRPETDTSKPAGLMSLIQPQTDRFLVYRVNLLVD